MQSNTLCPTCGRQMHFTVNQSRGDYFALLACQSDLCRAPAAAFAKGKTSEEACSAAYAEFRRHHPLPA
jgi:hypothetical protein